MTHRLVLLYFAAGLTACVYLLLHVAGIFAHVTAAL
jgi:hypothetical protein